MIGFMEPVSKIFIYGAPGVGKTTYGRRLKSELDYPLVEADYLREVVAQKEKTEKEDPFLYVGTKEAFRRFGALTEENVVKGLKAVRESMSFYVDREISKFPDNLIMEAAFLDPQKLQKFGKLILIETPDKEKHSSQYFQHRERTYDRIEGFEASRIIQDYLIKESENFPVEIIEN
ncbi:MAG: hypothetical protein A2751_00940 [Candidatus Doudnabacteria bacterium RIFCSPHIGHO2_01_FULL_46_14]|uniref:NadR/Ttd14 AAA domain-containing protein n=1 Tax=Candidatus Doudnabacteria bacterium RIFCSPHIGHO2_01_FULL_46_14 TaxID=1817824 RepID=A0A1F5NMV3_9BACT|nr:MAG: hypothetical protein A2751_00940 [Candidatus Doudnabacteria bacterium RIFCSPHIGHO2_01_FULL_46_14]